MVHLTTIFKMFETKAETIVTVLVVKLFCTFHVSGYNKATDGVIYILVWSPVGWTPFDVIPMEHEAFQKCTFNNCFLTGNHSYFKNVMDFDVLMFGIWQVGLANLDSESSVILPSNRSERQKYCMYTMEPPGFHKIYESWNGFFNMTMTYKFISNSSIPYVVVKDHNDKVIGPKVDMHWMQLSEMNETSDFVKHKLQNKHVAAAWIVSNCETPWRFYYAQRLTKALAQYGHRLDIYGRCGTISCPRERMEECLALIESDYYFYLSFENSFTEDYVTEKILHALEHFAVPVVFGSANYSRFMPEGIYLDANILPPDEMAARMNEIINDKNQYYEFFRWHDHYSFHFTGEDHYSREVCGLCAFLNNSKNKTGIMDNISFWWNVEWPPWPEEIDEPTEVEQGVRNLLNFLDPSSEE